MAAEKWSGSPAPEKGLPTPRTDEGLLEDFNVLELLEIFRPEALVEADKSLKHLL